MSGAPLALSGRWFGVAERVVIEGPGRRVPEGVVDVGVSWSRWRNPFIGSRAGEFERYRLSMRDPDRQAAARAELAGRDLACTCREGDPWCHAELLLRVAAGEEP